MGGSRHSEHQVTETYARPAGDAGGTGEPRPKWLWGWVAVFTCLGILALILVGIWVGSAGGVAWEDYLVPDLMFNHHPLFMILGFLFILGHTNLIYRLFPNGNPLALKISHGTLQLLSYILMILGVYAVGWSKDYSGSQTPPRHFVSVHSWLGLTVLIIMGLQWVCGFFGLLVPGCKGDRRVQYRTTHIFTGNIIFLLGCATILVGIDQLKPTATMNTLALTVVAYLILGGYLLSTDRFKRGNAEHIDGDAANEERAPLVNPQARYD